MNKGSLIRTSHDKIHHGEMLALIAALLLGACQRTPTPTASPTPAGSSPSATLTEAINDVTARGSEAEAFAAAGVGHVVRVGGEVRTGDSSKARLDLSDNSILRLAPNSNFTLQRLPDPANAEPAARLKLVIGKLWASLFGGGLEVETPAGVATVRGSFATIEYVAGDPNTNADDILIVSCLEGQCGVSNATVNESLGNLQQVILTNGGAQVVRFALNDAAVQEFLSENPEALSMVATLTAAAPTFTPPPALPNTPTPTPVSTETPTPTPSPTTSATPFPLIGQHTVQSGETIFCIGRTYGVVPAAIAEVNGIPLPYTIIAGQVLKVPAVQWINIAAGPTCAPQFVSPYPGLPTATATLPGVSSPTPTNTPPNVTLTPTFTSPPPSAASATPTVTATSSLVPDTSPPTLALFGARPLLADKGQGTCSVTFFVTITDASGVSSASVEWSSYDYLATPAPGGSGSVAMTLNSGTSTSGVWQALFVVNIPPYGWLNWDAKATDTAGNSLTQPSGITINSATGGCP